MRASQPKTSVGDSIASLPSPWLAGGLLVTAILSAIYVGYAAVVNPGLLLLLAVPTGLGLVVWGVRSRVGFPYMLVFVLGFEQFTLDPNSSLLTVSKVAGVLLFAIYFFSRSRDGKPLIYSFRHIPLQFGLQLLLVFWFAVSSLWSVRTDRALVALSTFALLLGLTWIIADFVQSPKEVRWFTQAIVAYGLVLAIYAIWQYQGNLDVVMQGVTNFRSESINDNPNIAAQYMVLAMGILLGRLILQPKWHSIVVDAIGMLVLLLGISATGSRGGAVAAAIVCVAAFLFVLYRFGMWRTLRFVLLIGTGIAIVYFFFPYYWAVLERRFNGEGSNVTGYRTELITIALQYFQERPIFGIGFEGFRSYNLALTHLPPHNTYTGLLAETGLVGFGIFISVLLTAFGNLWFSIRLAVEHSELRPNLIELLSLLLGLVGLCAAFFFGDNADNKLFWLILALVQMATLIVRQASIKNGLHPKAKDISEASF